MRLRLTGKGTFLRRNQGILYLLLPIWEGKLNSSLL